MFIAVILTGYEDSTALEDSCLTGADMDNFREAWALFDPKATEWISVPMLWPFLRNLDSSIGWKDDAEKEKDLSEYFAKINFYAAPTIHFFELASHLAAFKTGAYLNADDPVYKRMQEMV